MARVVLVTGSTDGIGRQTARQLAAAGLTVIVHGRSRPKVDQAIASIRDELPGATLEGVAFDLGTLAGVRRGAAQIAKVAPELHVLVNNAGIFATERVLNEDGVEATFAVNHLGPLLLTELLMPALERSAQAVPSRVINVASVAHTRGRIHLDDLQLASVVDRLRRVRAEQARERDARDLARRAARSDQARRVQRAPGRDRDEAAAAGLRAGARLERRGGCQDAGAARIGRGGHRSIGQLLQRRRRDPAGRRRARA